MSGVTLSKEAQYTLSQLGGEWQAGPTMRGRALLGLDELRCLGLVEREFLDRSTEVQRSGGQVSARIRACWHFRLTAAGLAAKAEGRADG
jgi:hypothetical protein